MNIISLQLRLNITKNIKDASTGYSIRSFFTKQNLNNKKETINLGYKPAVIGKEEEPFKFSTSPAGKRVMNPLFVKIKHPWYQPPIVIASVAVFLIYFTILREENDVDLEFTKSLIERRPAMEKEQLLICYKYNKENGLSVTEIEKRLQEIEEEEVKENS